MAGCTTYQSRDLGKVTQPFCLSSITSKMGITIVLASLSCCEDLREFVYVKSLEHSTVNIV